MNIYFTDDYQYDKNKNINNINLFIKRNIDYICALKII